LNHFLIERILILQLRDDIPIKNGTFLMLLKAAFTDGDSKNSKSFCVEDDEKSKMSDRIIPEGWETDRSMMVIIHLA